jgi:hypothetical protein
MGRKMRDLDQMGPIEVEELVEEVNEMCLPLHLSRSQVPPLRSSDIRP